MAYQATASFPVPCRGDDEDARREVPHEAYGLLAGKGLTRGRLIRVGAATSWAITVREA